MCCPMQAMDSTVRSKIARFIIPSVRASEYRCSSDFFVGFYPTWLSVLLPFLEVLSANPLETREPTSPDRVICCKPLRYYK